MKHPRQEESPPSPPTKHARTTTPPPPTSSTSKMDSPPKPAFSPQRNLGTVVKIQGLASPDKGKGKASVGGIGMGGAKGLDGAGQPRQLGGFKARAGQGGGFGKGFAGTTVNGEIKKLVVKNAKPAAASPSQGVPDGKQAFVNNALETLIRSVRAITSVPPERTPESLQALYGLCEGVVSQGSSSSQTLYDRTKVELERRAGEIFRVVSSAATDSSGARSPPSTLPVLEPAETVIAPPPTTADAAAEEAWLARLDAEWRRWSNQLLMIRSVLLHLDRAYVLNQPALLPIWDLGLDIFRHAVIEPSPVASRLTSYVLSFVSSDRDGLSSPRALLHSLTSHLRILSPLAYTTLFLSPFLSSTRTYYLSEAARRLGDEGVPIGGEKGYLRAIELRLDEEVDRCESIVPPSEAVGVKAEVLRIMEHELVFVHLSQILDRGLAPLLTSFETPNPSSAPTESGGLASMYSLLARVGSLGELRAAFLRWLKETGKALISDPKMDEGMVERLIAFKRKVDSVVQGPFRDDPEFVHAEKDGFEVFVNTRENKPAEMIAKFLDAKLRLGNRGMTDAELEDALDHVLVLFRYTQGKDVFEAFYKRDLGKRLLLGKSASHDAERSMLMKLKDECGPGFTIKLEVMFKDVDVSADIMKAYRASTRPEASDPLELNVSVLTTGNWPPYPQANLVLPPEMSASLDRFRGFYLSKHSGRKLTWAHALDHCVVAAKFPKGGRKELAVSLHQALVLLLFNDKGPDEKVSYRDIVQQTGLEAKEAARTLQSLACGKVRVLVKTPKGKDVDPDDEFAFNVGFKDDHFRIKINQIQAKETNEEQKATTDRVFMDRSSHLQLAVVRILKSRKEMKHAELVLEVISQIKDRFKVEVGPLKLAIESLISREYMERVEGKRDVYRYLA